MTIKLVDAATYFKNLTHQRESWEWLEKQLTEEQLNKFAELYRHNPYVDEDLVDNSWQGIYNAAKKAGAKFPECVAAQWALESGYGKFISGKNNFFGIKGKGTVHTTWEDYGNGPVTIRASFKDFDTPFDCVNYLVTRWYKDYRSYRGVNRAGSRQECARLLKAEGYATDPIYADKLIQIMDKHA